MQMIRITNLPIQYQYEIERARFEPRQTEPLEAKMSFTKPNLQLRSKNIEVRLNSDAMRESLGMRTNSSWARISAQRGIEKARKGIDETVQMGDQMQRIDEGVTIAQIIQNKVFEQPTTYAALVPLAAVDIGWEPAELNMQYDPGSVDIDWQMKKLAMDFIPGRFNLVITQYPKVSIEYLGGINYVPPSSNPDYDGPVT